jgi:thiol-disulfide isomerase/thioredoxin
VSVYSQAAAFVFLAFVTHVSSWDTIDVDAVQPRKVTGEELEVALADRTKPIIIDFYADWCGPCVLLAKELEKV